jgi:hypothetical protein
MSSAETLPDPAQSEERQRLAQELLREAVFQARARQAAGIGIAGSGPEDSGGCGLGREPASEIELSSRGRELLKELWLRPLAPTEVEHVQGSIQGWIERQDAFDRKRNHFLREFRQAHGFDRRLYDAQVARSFEDGLQRINAEVEERLQEAARELLAGA